MLVKQDPPTGMQQLIYQIALAITLSTSLLSALALGLLVSFPSGDNVFYVSLMTLLAVLMWVALLAAKQGHQAGGVMLVGLPLLASTLVGVMVADSAVVASFSYAIPLVLASMMLRPRQVVGVLLLCLALSTTLLVLAARGISGPIMPSGALYLCGGIAMLLTMSLVTLFSVRGQQTLRAAQGAAEAYARELEGTHRELRQRQRELEAAQELLAQRNKALQHKLVTVGELGVGVVPLAPGVLIVPVHGDITLDAAHNLRARLLAACTVQNAEIVVLDMALAQLRPSAARVLSRTLESIAVLGVHVVVTGPTEALEPLSPLVVRAESLAEVLVAMGR